jgi:hypothetical protein
MSIRHDEHTTQQGSSASVERAKGAAADTASTAKMDAKEVASTAKEQFQHLVDEAKTDVSRQGDNLAHRAAERLRDLERQSQSLLEGRSQEAGPLADYVREAQHKVQSLAGRLEERGGQGVVDDIVRYGRRRPGTFLIGAAALGFLTARVLRVGASAQNGASGMQGGYGESAYGGAYGTAGATVPRPVVASTGPVVTPGSSAASTARPATNPMVER